jgi:hypothetical protein
VLKVTLLERYVLSKDDIFSLLVKERHLLPVWKEREDVAELDHSFA